MADPKLRKYDGSMYTGAITRLPTRVRQLVIGLGIISDPFGVNIL